MRPRNSENGLVDGLAGRAKARTPIVAGVPRLLVAGLLVLATFAAYWPALAGDLIFSDIMVIPDNPYMTSADGLWRIWFVGDRDQYQPLTYTTYWLERRLWGLNPLGYHVVNVALHAGSACCVWLLLSRLRARGAAVAALLFALHPVNVESVAWVYERKNVLSALLYFLTLAAYLRFEDTGKWRWYGWALVLFAGALLAKSATVVLPAVLLLYWWWRRNAWPRVLARLIPFLVLGGVMAAITVRVEHANFELVGPAYESPLMERFARAGWIVGFYLGKLIFPSQLNLWYPRWTVDPASLTSYLPHLGMLAVLCLLLWKRDTWGRPALLGLGYYLIALLPVLGFFDIYYHRHSFVADHFQYLAAVGVIALGVHATAYGLDQAAPRVRAARRRFVTLMRPGLALLAVVLCGLLTARRAAIFRNLPAACADSLAKDPDCWMAHSQLGQYWALAPGGNPERLARAVSHLEHAVRLRPDDAGSLVALGGALRTLGRFADAEHYLRCAVAAQPTEAAVHHNLGNILLEQGRIDEAIGAYQEAVRLKLDFVAARYSLADALFKRGRIDEAIVHLNEVLRLQPGNQRAAAYLRHMQQALQRRGAASQPGNP